MESELEESARQRKYLQKSGDKANEVFKQNWSPGFQERDYQKGGC